MKKGRVGKGGVGIEDYHNIIYRLNAYITEFKKKDNRDELYNYIINDRNVVKCIDLYIEKTIKIKFYNYIGEFSINKIDIDDFKNEVWVMLMLSLKKYDYEKSNISRYIFNAICFTFFTQYYKIKNINKIEIKLKEFFDIENG